MSFDPAEIQEFVAEAIDLLDQAEQALIRMDGGQSTVDWYSIVFRSFHSVKGSAGMTGWVQLQSHMHQIENRLSGFKGQPTLPAGEVSELLRGIDVAKALLAGQELPSEPLVPSTSHPQPTSQAVPPALSKTIHPQIASISQPVVIIDDEPDLLELTKEMVTHLSLTVVEFLDPLLAIDYFNQNSSPLLVISDMKMPQKTGLDVLRSLRTKHPLTPFILLSGHLTKQELIEASQLSIFAAIEKPAPEDALIGHIKNAINLSLTTQAARQAIDLLFQHFGTLQTALTAKNRIRELDALKSQIKGIKSKLEGIR